MTDSSKFMTTRTEIHTKQHDFTTAAQTAETEQRHNMNRRRFRRITAAALYMCLLPILK